MKRVYSELLNIDSEDAKIMEKTYKRRRLNTIKETNNLFQETYDVSLDLKPILSDFLNIDIGNEVYCIYCNKVNLYDDCINCKKCNKVICEECEKMYWNKLIDFRKDELLDCCPTCIKKYKCCNICKNFYKTYSETLDNKKCKKCKKYTCKICMNKRFQKVEIVEHDTHVGGGCYRKFSHVFIF